MNTRSKNLATVASLGVVSLLALTLFLLPTPNDAAIATTGQFAIVGTRVFDGERTWPQADVLVNQGRVEAIAEKLELPAGTEVIDGAGKTLLPGLLDAHVHTWGTARADAVRFGVTTLLDQFTAPTELATARADRDQGGAQDRADLFSAGTLATAKGGHGTQFGMTFDTLTAPEEASAWVKARKEEGSDWIKIVVEPGWGRPLETLNRQTVAALIEAAHQNNLKAVVHVSLLDDALAVVEMGADGLVHVWRDRLPTADEVEIFRQAEIFVIPTLVVMEGMVDPSPSLALRDGPLGKGLSAIQKGTLEQRFPASVQLDWKVPVESVRRLAAAGVPILAGSDAPNPSTSHGLSLHRELQLLTTAGLTAEGALAAATSLPAEHFDVPARGTIRSGSLADLVLVNGDPTQNISATQQLAGVWKAGHSVNLATPSGAPDATNTEAAPAPAETLLADFGDGLKSRFGLGWVETTDQRMGGKSIVNLAVQDGALHIDGEIRPGAMFPWAGALVFPGQAPMAAVDFSERTELRFRVRGDGRTYSAMVFSGSMEGIPPSQNFQASDAWSTVTLPLDAFYGAKRELLRGIAFTAVGPPGDFFFELDDVEIR